MIHMTVETLLVLALCGCGIALFYSFHSSARSRRNEVLGRFESESLGMAESPTAALFREVGAPAPPQHMPPSTPLSPADLTADLAAASPPVDAVPPTVDPTPGPAPSPPPIPGASLAATFGGINLPPTLRPVPPLPHQPPHVAFFAVSDDPGMVAAQLDNALRAIGAETSWNDGASVQVRRRSDEGDVRTGTMELFGPGDAAALGFPAIDGQPLIRVTATG